MARDAAPWEVVKQVQVTFTGQLTRKRPVWKEGKLRLSGGVATLFNEHSIEVDSIVVSVHLLATLRSGGQVQLERHLVEVPEPPPGVALAGEGAPASAESGNASPGAPKAPFKRPRMLLVPAPVAAASPAASMRLPATVARPAALAAPEPAGAAAESAVGSAAGSAVGSAAAPFSGGLWEACVMEEQRAQQDDDDGPWKRCMRDDEAVRAWTSRLLRKWGNRQQIPVSADHISECR
eukprot:NODE_19816_length_826_cov_3.942775.p1 GENE.NODE_19816_length_826_cov_3.942775~~NODE_19816_length_826_cov_3.942775.p1  ORF type:complete len:236 (-),score=42.66 NODE_19816_length_826_cov_3.942775:3-710(-)